MLRASRGGLANEHPERFAHHPSDASARTHATSFFEARVGSKSQHPTALLLNGGSGIRTHEVLSDQRLSRAPP